MPRTTQNTLRLHLVLLYVAEALIWLHITRLGQRLIHYVAMETEDDGGNPAA